MNKFIIALPIFALLALGGILYYKNSNNYLESSLTIPNDLTIYNFAQCYQNLPAITDSCKNTDAYNQAATNFNNLTSAQSDNPNTACINYNKFFQTAFASQPLNQNNYFADCYLNDQALAIAKSNQCFYDKYFAPFYLQCTRSSASSSSSSSSSDSNKPKNNLTTVTFTQYAECLKTLQYSVQPCQTTDAYYSTVSQFVDLTYPDSSNVSSDCKNYYSYLKVAHADDLINKNNYYQSCFLSSKIQSIAQSNDCFNQYYYKPIYTTCLGN
ncbi:transmembrane protein, putative (macronuclear) [Tetrahymena thermophila SB210]|uniref:Transmembrane protein, putative n=1 Tax=Tetrahymena thermophila (strain SB210) TaxID=312017 RepID=Q22T29_TETTS|nr:transmembrane protein, putative [Tetrahymena thermophila SB210]EAR88609.1 transmembrane protein, putative [Tetrahymena thermophila SB210]|eukprot:XP_001008854.1 transmembrane protein, putative [Tetrahymena thermophila SB210]